jgi:uncharacterized membrane protein
MRLQLGDDELIFFDAYKAAVTPTEERNAKEAPSRSRQWMVIALVALVALVAIAALLIWGGGQ